MNFNWNLTQPKGQKLNKENEKEKKKKERKEKVRKKKKLSANNVSCLKFLTLNLSGF